MRRFSFLTLFLGIAFFAASASADITVDTAWVTQYEITPTEDGYTRTLQKGLKLPYDECEAEMLAAQDAMNAREIAAARALNYPIHTDFASGAPDADPDGYKPVSVAQCLRERWVVMVRASGVSREPIQCSRVWVEGFDWADQYASVDTCP